MAHSDVKATQPRTTTGAFLDQGGNALNRCRLQGVYFVASGSAGTVEITDGTTTLVELASPAGAGEVTVDVPGNGILSRSGLTLGTLTNVTSVTLFYEG